VKITGIQIKDFLILEDIEIHPDSKKNVFVGKNRQGKTSIAKAIRVGMLGTNDDTMIRNGADEAKIMLELDGGAITVDRRLKRDATNRLTVKGKVTLPNGEEVVQPLPSPQEQLKKLISPYAFDPIEFVLLDGADRVKYFQKHFPVQIKREDLEGWVSDDILDRLDFSKDAFTLLKEVENIIYPQRTAINKEIKRKKAIYDEGMTAISGFDPDNYVDRVEEAERHAKECEARLTSARATEKQTEATKQHIERLNGKIADINNQLAEIDQVIINSIPQTRQRIAEIEAEIARLQSLLDESRAALQVAEELKAKYDNLIAEKERHQETIAALPTTETPPDFNALEADLAEAMKELDYAKAEREKFEKFKDLSAIREEYEKKQSEADKITATLEYIRKELPTRIASEAKLPIENMKIEGDKMFVNGVSIDNCSTREGVEIGLNIVRAVTPPNGLKAICLDRAESLDDEALAAFDEQIKNDEFQYWITIVEHEGAKIPEGAFHVEGGRVQKIGDDKQAKS
jgi:DNA repair exonuclease SbcCD ATPase subunit